VRFGSLHEGKTYWEVLQEDLGYCQQVLHNLGTGKWSGPEYESFGAWLRAQGVSEPTETSITIACDMYSYPKLFKPTRPTSRPPKLFKPTRPTSRPDRKRPSWRRADSVQAREVPELAIHDLVPSSSAPRVVSNDQKRKPPKAGRFADDPGSRRVGFGKHQDLTYVEAFNLHPGYCTGWVLREWKAGRRVDRTFVAFAEWVAEQTDRFPRSP
jgi:hypothetical protein